MKYAYDYLSRPKQFFTVSGDMVFIKEMDASLFAALVDVAGHGEKAYQVAQEIYPFLEEAASPNPILVLEALHDFLKGTVGAVAGIAFLEGNQLHYASVGNITAVYNGSKLTTNRGLLGIRMRTPVLQTLELKEGGLFLMYSDGVHINGGDLPAHSPDKICRYILDTYSVMYDDASVIAIQTYG